MREYPAKKFSFTLYDRQHIQNLAKQAVRLDKIFKDAIAKGTKIGEASGFCDPNGEFFFDNYPALKERVEKFFTALHDNLLLTITEGNREEWLLAAAKNSAMVDAYYKKAKKKYGKQAEEWTDRHMEGLKAFNNRVERGMNLSDRVWKLKDQFKQELELALELGLGEGKSAAVLSKDVRQYLNEPHKLFRRVRNEKGQLRLSKAAAAYHPGTGVYRSSYMNALRLTATENNIAYRTSDFDRWQQMDFVTGIQIKLSNNHTLNGKPFVDICDHLKGYYPKDFKFVGWHPFCRCIAVPKLADEDEFIERQQSFIDGEPATDKPYSGEIPTLPKNFTDWVEENADKIETARSKPYFIQDNRKAIKNIISPSKDKKPEIEFNRKKNIPKLTIQEIAEIRHSQRTPERIHFLNNWANNHSEYFNLINDPNYYDIKFHTESGGLMATEKGHIIRNSKKEKKFFNGLSASDLEKECQNVLFENGFKCILLNEKKKDKKGNQLPQLDSLINDKLSDIRSITEVKVHYGAAIHAKIKQLHNFNTKCSQDASTITLFFHDETMFTGKECIIKGLVWIKKNFNTDISVLKRIYAVTSKGKVEIINI